MSRDKKKGFVLYCDSDFIFDMLTDQQAGQLFKAIFVFANSGEDTSDQLDEVTKMAFLPIRNYLIRDQAKYEEKCEKNRKIAVEREKKKREKKKKNKAKQEEKEDSTSVHESAQTYTNGTDRNREREREKEREKEKETDTEKKERVPRGGEENKVTHFQPRNRGYETDHMEALNKLIEGLS